jgi:hypothetical protein
MSITLAIPLAMFLIAGPDKPPVDPITIHLTRVATPASRSKEELKALATERKQAMDATAKSNFQVEKDMKKQYGGDFKKWPLDAQERAWDVAESTAQATDLWRQTQGQQSGEQMRSEHEQLLRKELAKKKLLRLVDNPAEADLMIEMIDTARLKIALGTRLRPLPPDRLDHRPLRHDKRYPYLELQHRYKASEPFWRFLCPNAWEQAEVLETFAEANGAVVREARP